MRTTLIGGMVLGVLLLVLRRCVSGLVLMLLVAVGLVDVVMGVHLPPSELVAHPLELVVYLPSEHYLPWY